MANDEEKSVQGIDTWYSIYKQTTLPISTEMAPDHLKIEETLKCDWLTVNTAMLFCLQVGSNHPINVTDLNTLLNTLILGGYSLGGSAVDLRV